MTDWIFLDVGNVLLDEDRLAFETFRHYSGSILAARPDLTVDDLLAAFESEIGRTPWPLYGMASAYLDDARLLEIWNEADRDIRPRYAELSPPIPGADEVLDQIAKVARLGLIANQPIEGRDRLEALGWLDRFEVVVLSGLEGVSKPDPRLFAIALERSGADPARSWMIGDRLDNDIGPAASLGLKTILLRWPDRRAKGWNPGDPEASAYLSALERAALRIEAAWDGAAPTVVAEAIDGLGAIFRADARIRGCSGSRPASDRRP